MPQHSARRAPPVQGRHHGCWWCCQVRPVSVWLHARYLHPSIHCFDLQDRQDLRSPSRLCYRPITAESMWQHPMRMGCCRRWRLLTASEDGTLRLLQLVGDNPVQAQTASLPPDCNLMALSEPSRWLGVVQRGRYPCPAVEYPYGPGWPMKVDPSPVVLHCLDLDNLLGTSSEAVSGEIRSTPALFHDR